MEEPTGINDWKPLDLPRIVSAVGSVITHLPLVEGNIRISHTDTDDVSLVILHRERLIFWWRDPVLLLLHQCAPTQLMCEAFLVDQLVPCPSPS